MTARGTDAAQGFRDIVLGLDVDADEVRAGIEETLEIMIRAGNHQVDIEEGVVGGIDGLDDGRAERDVVHEMPVHHIEMHPIGPGLHRAGDFIADF